MVLLRYRYIPRIFGGPIPVLIAVPQLAVVSDKAVHQAAVSDLAVHQATATDALPDKATISDQG